MKKCLIIGSAVIEDYPAASNCISGDEFVIVCDGGLKHLEGLGVYPDLITGDFDSAKDPHLPVETIILPREKDDTDTMYAVKVAIDRGFTDFTFLGVTGERLDHTLGNVYILYMLYKKGLEGRIIDDYSEMVIVSEKAQLIPDTFPYFSLINISGETSGITIEDAKYPLSDAEITQEYQYGISNEVLPGKCAKVTVKHGCLLLIKVKRDSLDK